jgi:SAM-dependent methyltransferase
MRVDPASFEAKYAGGSDPWSFATSAYELGRYDATIDLLDGTYRRAFEPACSIGVLTARLAERCTEVVAVDPSPSAVATARQRLTDRPGVRIEVGAIPEWWPDGSFELVVFSELGYYWDRAGLSELIDRLAGIVEPGGDLVAVHWRGSSPDHVLHGDEVHAALVERLGRPVVSDERAEFVAARWRR